MQSIFRVSNILIQICLSENCGQVQLGNRFATLAAVQAIAFVIGPVVGGQLAKRDKVLPMFASCVLCVCNIFVQFFVKPNYSMDESAIKKKDNNELDECSYLFPCCIFEEKSNFDSLSCKRMEGVGIKKSSVMLNKWMTVEYLFIFHVKIIFTFANCIYESIFAQYMLSQLHLDGSSIGWMLGYIGLMTTFANTLVVKSYLLLVQRHYFALVYAAVLHAVGLVSWATTSTVYLSMLASALIALTNQIISNYLQTLVAFKTNRDNRGEVLGFSQSMERAARAIAPFLGGFAYQQYGVKGLAVAGVIPSIYCAIAFLLNYPNVRGAAGRGKA